MQHNTVLRLLQAVATMHVSCGEVAMQDSLQWATSTQALVCVTIWQQHYPNDVTIPRRNMRGGSNTYTVHGVRMSQVGKLDESQCEPHAAPDCAALRCHSCVCTCIYTTVGSAGHALLS